MYGKYHASTFTGSMRGAGVTTFAVWGWIIANTNQHSVVEINPDIVAFLLGCTPEEVGQTVAKLCEPDPHSRSKQCDGRRLVKEGEYQYFVPTHEQYREMQTTEEKREYNRVKKQESRARQKEGVKQPVKDVSQCQTTEAEAEAEADNIKSSRSAVASLTDEEWLNGLEKDNTYSHLNIRVEYGKMIRWCEVSKKPATKRRFVNWLNRADRPMKAIKKPNNTDNIVQDY